MQMRPLESCDCSLRATYAGSSERGLRGALPMSLLLEWYAKTKCTMDQLACKLLSWSLSSSNRHTQYQRFCQPPPPSMLLWLFCFHKNPETEGCNVVSLLQLKFIGSSPPPAAGSATPPDGGVSGGGTEEKAARTSMTSAVMLSLLPLRIASSTSALDILRESPNFPAHLTAASFERTSHIPSDAKIMNSSPGCSTRMTTSGSGIIWFFP
mmetsp:Transcript_12997/g.25964  ORF Transcript_12997/g.25964 Transcript_12997/m.25964 type:complete len:210 (-) Transcript_12997:716-1345(-)